MLGRQRLDVHDRYNFYEAKVLWYLGFILLFTGCCAPVPCKPVLHYEFEKELKMKRRSWIFRYKNRAGVTLIPTNDLYWLMEEARKE